MGALRAVGVLGLPMQDGPIVPAFARGQACVDLVAAYSYFVGRVRIRWTAKGVHSSVSAAIRAARSVCATHAFATFRIPG
jgi:hypothetical protein